MRLSEKIAAGVCMLAALVLVVYFSYQNSVIDTGWFILLAGSLMVIIGCCLFLYRCLRLKERQEQDLLLLNRSIEANRQLMMNASLDAIVCTDTFGVISSWNTQAEILFGWPAAEVIGKKLYDVIAPREDRQQYQDELEGYRRHGFANAMNVRREVNVVDRNGKLFPAEFTMLDIKQESELYFCTFIRDISLRKLEENALKEQSTEFRKLSSYLQSVREAERKHMAREVHDELGQLVSALKIDIDWMNVRVKTLEENEKKRLAHASSTLEILILAIRRMASSLRPSILDDFGLNATVEWQCREFQHTHGIACSFVCDFDDHGLPVQVRTEMFRIVQESLANVIDHSEAGNVKVEISSDREHIHMRIEDDGKGFDIDSTKHTLGLFGLRERAAAVNGTLRIESRPGKGTTVVAIIPKR